MLEGWWKGLNELLVGFTCVFFYSTPSCPINLSPVGKQIGFLQPQQTTHFLAEQSQGLSCFTRIYCFQLKGVVTIF